MFKKRPLAAEMALLAAVSAGAAVPTTATASMLMLQQQPFVIPPGMMGDLVEASATLDMDGMDMSSDTVSFNKFNPMQGTLNSVKIELDSTVSGSLSLTGSGRTGTVEATASWEADATVDLGLMPLFDTNKMFDTSCTGPSGGSGTSSCNSLGKTLGGAMVSNVFMDMMVFNAPLDLAAFTGVGMFDLDLKLALQTGCDVQGVESRPMCDAEADAFWGGNLKVTYQFDPPPPPPPSVPEPGTLALLAAGLAGIGWRRRRRAT